MWFVCGSEGAATCSSADRVERTRWSGDDEGDARYAARKRSRAGSSSATRASMDFWLDRDSSERHGGGGDAGDGADAEPEEDEVDGAGLGVGIASTRTAAGAYEVSLKVHTRPIPARRLTARRSDWLLLLLQRSESFPPRRVVRPVDVASVLDLRLRGSCSACCCSSPRDSCGRTCSASRGDERRRSAALLP